MTKHTAVRLGLLVQDQRSSLFLAITESLSSRAISLPVGCAGPFLCASFCTSSMNFWSAATNSEANPEIKAKIQTAQVMTVISWCTYPVVYLFPMLGIKATTAVVSIQI